MDTPGRGGYPCWNVDACPPTVSCATDAPERFRDDEIGALSMSRNGVQIEALAGPEFLPILSLNHGV